MNQNDLEKKVKILEDIVVFLFPLIKPILTKKEAEIIGKMIDGLKIPKQS
jgi:hypothetical protein